MLFEKFKNIIEQGENVNDKDEMYYTFEEIFKSNDLTTLEKESLCILYFNTNGKILFNIIDYISPETIMDNKKMREYVLNEMPQYSKKIMDLTVDECFLLIERTSYAVNHCSNLHPEHAEKFKIHHIYSGFPPSNIKNYTEVLTSDDISYIILKSNKNLIEYDFVNLKECKNFNDNHYCMALVKSPKLICYIPKVEDVFSRIYFEELSGSKVKSEIKNLYNEYRNLDRHFHPFFVNEVVTVDIMLDAYYDLYIN